MEHTIAGTRVLQSPTTAELGQRMASRRRDGGYSQRLIARRAGLDPSYLSRIETGKVQPTIGTALRIAGALRLSLDELVGPAPPERLGQACPVSVRGTCLLEHVGAGSKADGTDTTITTPQQLRLVRQATRMVQQSTPQVLKALEVLFDEMLNSGGATEQSA